MGHWYTTSGEPMHWIEGANGKQRDTTLRDARKLNLLPSVTEIINTLDKPALTRWKLRQVTQACYNFPQPEGESYDTYHDYLLKCAFENSTDARDRGSEIHNCIEMILKDGYEAVRGVDGDIRKIADAALLAIFRYTGTYLHDFVDGNTLTAEQIAVGNGFAGMVDAHNDDFIIDWKTKDIEEGKRNYWPEMAMQLAAYNQALGGDHRCINVFIDRTTPGLVEIYEWPAEEIKTAWQKFELLLKYWQLAKNYFPS